MHLIQILRLCILSLIKKIQAIVQLAWDTKAELNLLAKPFSPLPRWFLIHVLEVGFDGWVGVVAVGGCGSELAAVGPVLVLGQQLFLLEREEGVLQRIVRDEREVEQACACATLLIFFLYFNLLCRKAQNTSKCTCFKNHDVKILNSQMHFQNNFFVVLWKTKVRLWSTGTSFSYKIASS